MKKALVLTLAFGATFWLSGCVVVEEGWPFCGIGAQVVDEIQRDAFDHLDAPVVRVTGADVPMPYNKHLERAAKPNPDKVIAAVKQVTYLD